MFNIKNIFIVIIKSPVSTLSVSKDSNGVLDGDEVFGQTLSLEIVTEDEVITQVTVEMETNGNIAQNLTIESMQDVDALSSNVVGLIGEPLEFTSATEFDSATISFTIDQSQLGDTAFDNLLILWYNEEEGIFEEMPTDRDRVNSTVSTTTTHFSQYLVVDIWQNVVLLKWFLRECMKLLSETTTHQLLYLQIPKVSIIIGKSSLNMVIHGVRIGATFTI